MRIYKQHCDPQGNTADTVVWSKDLNLLFWKKNSYTLADIIVVLRIRGKNEIKRGENTEIDI